MIKKCISSAEKIDYISSLESNDRLCASDMNNIKRLAFDDDSELRYRVAELLALFPTDDSEKVLLEMISDTDYLVRASVCDSLSFSSSFATMKLLFRIAKKDKRFLVRGYAVLSIADIQQNIEELGNLDMSKQTILWLIELEQTETSTWVKIAIYRSLFLLGEYSYGKKLLCMLDNTRYRNRSCVISYLEEINDRGLMHKIPEMKQYLVNRLKLEKSFAVKTKIINFLERY